MLCFRLLSTSAQCVCVCGSFLWVDCLSCTFVAGSGEGAVCADIRGKLKLLMRCE